MNSDDKHALYIRIRDSIVHGYGWDKYDYYASMLCGESFTDFDAMTHYEWLQYREKPKRYYDVLHALDMQFHSEDKGYTNQQLIRKMYDEIYMKDNAEDLAKLNSKINKNTFIKSSATKKTHYEKYPTLKDYANRTSTNATTDELTDKILSKKSSGDPAQKDTLLHILNEDAKLNGKKCVFFDSSRNINSELGKNSYLNNIDGNDKDAAKFVLTLNNLDQFVEEGKYDKADTLLEMQQALTNDRDHRIISDIRSKLAAAHGVPADRIVIKDVYLNGVGVAYTVKDLTDSEKNTIITKSAKYESKMKKLFNDYDKCAIHPALFEQSYDIAMFDALGNKKFTEYENATYKVGPPGKERKYKQPEGWTRYGLKVLGKFENDKWLHPFKDPGNWYRAFHGTTREAGSSIFKGAFRPGRNNAYGVGVYCSPDVNIAAGYCRSRGGTIKLQTKKGQKEFYFVFQVAVNPETMNNPQYIPRFDASCESCNYWIAPSGADIRPYGILIKEV